MDSGDRTQKVEQNEAVTDFLQECLLEAGVSEVKLTEVEQPQNAIAEIANKFDMSVEVSVEVSNFFNDPNGFATKNLREVIEENLVDVDARLIPDEVWKSTFQEYGFSRTPSGFFKGATIYVRESKYKEIFEPIPELSEGELQCLAFVLRIPHKKVSDQSSEYVSMEDLDQFEESIEEIVDQINENYRKYSSTSNDILTISDGEPVLNSIQVQERETKKFFYKAKYSKSNKISKKSSLTTLRHEWVHTQRLLHGGLSAVGTFFLELPPITLVADISYADYQVARMLLDIKTEGSFSKILEKYLADGDALTFYRATKNLLGNDIFVSLLTHNSREYLAQDTKDYELLTDMLMKKLNLDDEEVINSKYGKRISEISPFGIPRFLPKQ